MKNPPVFYREDFFIDVIRSDVSRISPKSCGGNKIE